MSTVYNRRSTDLIASQDPSLAENVYAVRAHMADGSALDLLVFAREDQAIHYAHHFRPMPLGFDSIEVVERRVIGATVDRRRTRAV
jgi:hypothetical protein